MNCTAKLETKFMHYKQPAYFGPFTAYRAPSEPLNYQVECSFANCMTAISGVTHFPMDWGSACQDLSEKVQHVIVACLPFLLAGHSFVDLNNDDLTFGLVPWVNLSPFGQTLAQNWASETIQSELRAQKINSSYSTYYTFTVK